MKKLGLLLILSMLMLCGCTKQSRWQEQYDLGMQYLEEGNYDEAIVAFAAAIEVDEKRPEAYAGLSEAYEKIGDYEQTQNILKMGVEATGSEDLKERLVNIAEALKCTDESGRIIEERSTRDMLRELKDLCIQNNPEEIKEWINEQEHYDMMRTVMDQKVIYYQSDDEKRLAFYPLDQEKGRKGFFYYGSWDGEEWNGNGCLYWIGFDDVTSEREAYYYEDEWDHGQPLNMIQTMRTYMEQRNIEAADAFMMQKSCQFVLSLLSEDECYNQIDAENMGAGLYFIDNQVYCYYGQWDNMERSGEGIWMTPEFAEYYIFEGTWSDDAPNGSGREFWLYEDGQEGYVEGTYHNGLWDGEMTLINLSPYGAQRCEWSPITAKDGILEKITRERCPEAMLWTYDNLPHLFENQVDGTYMVAVTENYDEMWVRDDEYYAVEGFYPY